MAIKKITHLLFVFLCVSVLVSRSAVPLTDRLERVRAYTRDIEFDYVSWILDSLAIKASVGALSLEDYLPANQGHAIVIETMALTQQQISLVDQITRIYADPRVNDTRAETRVYREELTRVDKRLDDIGLTAENILQDQVTQVVADLGLTAGGQPIPPVLYHSTPVPMALIVSPRFTIRQDANISILADVGLEQITDLEQDVSQNLDVSALVVPVGGVGVYPTMIMRTGSLDWLSETIGHEWVHNYLTLRPLGMSYDLSQELHTMNETVASLAGKEIGAEVIRRYYPELWPNLEVAASPKVQAAAAADETPPFSFNAEMHKIRVRVDELLGSGKITEAEEYMDQSRQIFLDQGYVVRKLNQAYFAFYGAYADVPGGAAGADPVGPAVVRLREQSRSLADFLNRVSWMTSFEDLQAALR